jgi:very-short-patch-repair endonuclease
MTTKIPKLKRTTEQFIEEATKLHDGKYTYPFVKYTGITNKIIITCADHGNFEQTASHHISKTSKTGCPKCMILASRNKRSLTNKDIDKYLIEKNTNILRLGNYVNSHVKIPFGCLSCFNMWLARPSNVAYGHRGCPRCNDIKLTNNDIDNFLLENNVLVKRTSDYLGSHIKNSWECLVCNHSWNAAPSGIIRKDKENRQATGCPNCARGRNERIVGDAITELGIKLSKIIVKHSSGKKLYPDYYCPDFNIIIEYNGIQHYKPLSFSASVTKEEAEIIFQKQQIRDQILRDYCYEKKLTLLEIDGRKYKGDKLKKFVMDHFINMNGVSHE